MAKISEYSAVKLWPIVSYNLLRYSESIDYIIQNKLNDFFIFDGGEGFDFYLFV